MASRAVDAINAHRNALLLREQSAMQVQARAWLGVEAELNRVAVPLIEQAKQGNLSRGQIVQLERYQALMSQTSTQLKGYEGFMNDQITEGQRTAASMAIDHASSAINASAQDAGMMSVQFNRLPVAAVENMVGLTTTGSPLSSILADASRGAPERLGQELINSIALGRNPVETARLAVRRGLGPTFTRMRTIARTEQLRVYRQVSLASYSHSGVVDEYRRLSARDSRVCPACLFSDGRTYPISKPFAEHPQGRCTTIPVIRGHKAPAYETGEEWFKRQDVKTQRDILGNARYDLWREGKVKQLGDFIEEVHNDEWGDSMTTRSLYDVVGRRPPRPDRLASIVDESNSDYFSSASGSGLPEMSPEAAESWARGTKIPDELWVVKASSGADKIRMNGFGNTVILDADPAAMGKKLAANPDAQAVLVKVNVQKPALVVINPMSSSKDIAEKFFGRSLDDLQDETGEKDVYKIFAAKGYDALDLQPPSGKGRMVIVFDPYNAVPVKNKAEKPGPGGGGIRLGPKRWEPTMSRKDADEWAFSSAAGRDFYYVSGPDHSSGFDPIDGFSTKKGPFEHRFGDGVYLIADQDKTLAHYQDLAGANQKTVVTRVNVKKIAVVNDEGWTMTDDEILRLALKVKPKEARAMVAEYGSAHNALRSLNYDAIEFRSTHLKSVGGNRIIVFNKQNVVAIDGEAGPYVPKAGKPTTPPKTPTPPKPPPPPKPPTHPRDPIQDGTFVPKGYRVIPDGEEGDATLRAEYKEWLDGLTKEEKHALGVYYGSGASRINGDLRRGVPFFEPSDEKNVQLIDQALEKSRVPENLVVFRGMRNPRLAKAINEGRAMDITFFEDGYTSTTTSKKIAREKFTTPDDDSILAEIRLPKGKKGGLISPSYSEENEILLPRGSQYRVVGHHVENGKKVVTLEIVSQGADEEEEAFQAQEAALKAADKKKRLETPKTHLTAKYPTEQYGFYVDDEEISRAKSTSELEKILEQRYPGTSFDFHGAHLEVAQTTADEFHRLAQKYPNVAGELKYVGTYGTKSKIPKMASGTFNGSKTIAHASRDGKYIGLNLDSYAHPEKMMKDNKNSGWSGWTVQHGTEVYPALTHEFGHHIENYYYNKSNPRSVVTPYRTKSEWEVKKTYGNRNQGGTIQHMLWEFNRWTKPTTELSKYAVTTNDSVLGQNEEGWAEAFTKAELYPEDDWDPYTKAHRRFITVVKPDMSLYEKPSTEISTLPEKKQVEARGVIQDFYKKAGILFRG